MTASETTRIAVCIDLVCEIRGISIDLTDILNVTATRKANYLSYKHLFEKLLNIKKSLGVNEICIQLGLSEVKVDAEKILKFYQTTTGSSLNDLKHPQYATMSVFMACMKQKVRVSKQKFIPLSQLKPAQWNILEGQFEKILKINEGKTESSKTSKHIGKEYKMEVDDKEFGGVRKKINSDDQEEESYEHWKERVLKKAYEDLKRIKKEEIEYSSD